ncbi:MAG: methyltransferase domain-containing protein [Chloroflexota bacterium]
MPGPHFQTAWRTIDTAGDPHRFVRYMDAARPDEAVMLPLYRRLTRLLELGAPGHVLEVGCATGGTARELARLLAPHWRVTAIDKSRTMVAESRRRCHGLGLPVGYYVGDADALPFTDASFDGCYALGIFEILAHPQRAIAEMVRVLRPGARLAIVAGDQLAGHSRQADGESSAGAFSGASKTSDHHIAGQLSAAFHGCALLDVAVSRQSLPLPEYALLYQLWSEDHLAPLANDADTPAAQRTWSHLPPTTVHVVSGRRA